MQAIALRALPAATAARTSIADGARAQHSTHAHSKVDTVYTPCIHPVYNPRRLDTRTTSIQPLSTPYPPPLGWTRVQPSVQPLSVQPSSNPVCPPSAHPLSTPLSHPLPTLCPPFCPPFCPTLCPTLCPTHTFKRTHLSLGRSWRAAKVGCGWRAAKVGRRGPRPRDVRVGRP